MHAWYGLATCGRRHATCHRFICTTLDQMSQDLGCSCITLSACVDASHQPPGAGFTCLCMRKCQTICIRTMPKPPDCPFRSRKKCMPSPFVSCHAHPCPSFPILHFRDAAFLVRSHPSIRMWQVQKNKNSVVSESNRPALRWIRMHLVQRSVDQVRGLYVGTETLLQTNVTLERAVLLMGPCAYSSQFATSDVSCARCVFRPRILQSCSV